MEIVKTEKIIFTTKEYHVWNDMYDLMSTIMSESSNADVKNSALAIMEAMDNIDNYTTVEP